MFPMEKQWKILYFHDQLEEAYVAPTCLICLKLFEDGVGSAGCVSTEDCGSNNFIAAMSSKFFIVLILLALRNYRNMNP